MDNQLEENLAQLPPAILFGQYSPTGGGAEASYGPDMQEAYTPPGGGNDEIDNNSYDIQDQDDDMEISPQAEVAPLAPLDMPNDDRDTYSPVRGESAEPNPEWGKGYKDGGRQFQLVTLNVLKVRFADPPAGHTPLGPTEVGTLIGTSVNCLAYRTNFDGLTDKPLHAPGQHSKEREFFIVRKSTHVPTPL
jgi:hypothetical protein